jgi:hypothetical protein
MARPTSAARSTVPRSSRSRTSRPSSSTSTGSSSGGGAGIYLEAEHGESFSGSAQVFVYDRNTVNSLPTFENRGKVPRRSGYLIDE